MKRVLPIAFAAPFLLIGAAYPSERIGLPPIAVAPVPAIGHPPIAVEPAPTPPTYRPCRRGRGDDRCIQLYERGVRASYARWMRDRGVVRDRTEVAALGGPAEEIVRAPRRASSVSSERCHHGPEGHHGEARGM